MLTATSTTSSASQTAPWKVIAALAVTNLLVLASLVVLQTRAVWLLAAITFLAFVAITLRWPDIGTSVILFTIYSNIAVSLVRFNTSVNTTMDTDSRSALLVVVGLALVVPVFQYLWVRREPIIFDRPFALICLYAAALLLSTVFCLDPTLAAQKFLRFLCEGLVLYLLVINAVREERTLRKAMWALLLAAALMGALTVYQEATGTQDNPYWGLAQRGGVFAVDNTGQEVMTRTRAAGAIGEQNRYAQILLVVLPFALYLSRFSQSRRARLLAAVCGALVTCGIILTFSRGAFIALVLLSILMAMLRLVKPSHLVLGAVLIATVIVVRQPDYLTRLYSLRQVQTLFSSDNARPTADESATTRVAGNIASIRVFLQHPIIGVGRGVYAKYYATPEVYRLGVRQLHNYPSHNLYLNMAAESGIVGFVLFMSVIAVVFTRLRRLYTTNIDGDPKLRNLAACFLLGLCAYLLSGMFLHLGYERYFWLQIALCSAAIRVISQTVQIPVEFPGMSPSLSASDTVQVLGPSLVPWPRHQ